MMLEFVLKKGDRVIVFVLFCQIGNDVLIGD
jgi:hypothetical protein